MAMIVTSLVVTLAFAAAPVGNFKGQNGSLNIQKGLQFSYDSVNDRGNMCMIDGTFKQQGKLLTYEEEGCKMAVSVKSAKSIHLEVSGDCSYFCGMGASVDTEDMKK